MSRALANIVYSGIIGFFTLAILILIGINNFEGIAQTYKIAKPIIFVASSVFGVFYLMWLHNVYRTYIATNTSSNLSQPTRKQTASGAVWAHFLPINSLYAPYLILNEMQNNKRGGYINKDIWLTWFAPFLIPLGYLTICFVCIALPLSFIVDFMPEVVGIFGALLLAQGILIGKAIAVLGVIAIGGSYILSNWFLYQTVVKISQKQTDLLKVEDKEEEAI